MPFGSLWRRWRGAQVVGFDQYNNSYYRQAQSSGWPVPKNGREKRWVVYDSQPEASSIPPQWHAWLHHMNVQPPPQNPSYRPDWIKPHIPNCTGTVNAWQRPTKRPTTGYQAWKPKGR